jgi:hypothetical protein
MTILVRRVAQPSIRLVLFMSPGIVRHTPQFLFVLQARWGLASALQTCAEQGMEQGIMRMAWGYNGI